ncbi:hypothetical protein QAD02_013809 [Eretmocerus hayati]|uniref:Uncharacterized protein n=1 Tax=Eretmocerus hayati TaxID=131215 RepID=A0ACC2P3Q4_9HYME|nr:hypothetical protein QAD02_013809 [Eretmocerus hayati]
MRGREKDIIQAYQKFPFSGTKKSSKSIEDEALNLYEIICDTLDRCRTQKNDCTGHKEALESMGDRMWRIHQILKDRRTRPDFGIHLFCEQKLIRNHLHRVYSTKQTKLALNADDDKRLVFNDGVNTKALGYRRSE